MTFATPLFLLAAAAAAIPIVLHLMNRRKATEMPFPTLRFLKISVQKTRRKKQIQDILLMLLRAAVLLLIAAGLARPTIVGLASFWGGANSAAVIVLDNSTSMGRIDHDRIRFETAVSAANQILEQLGDGDEAALLQTCGPAAPDAERLNHVKDAVRQTLSHSHVCYECPDMDVKLRQARKLLAKSEAANKTIYVITDMQRSAWEAAAERQSSGTASAGGPVPTGGTAPNRQSQIPVVVIDCNRSPKPNVAVESLSLGATMPTVGVAVKTSVTLRNMSSAPEQRVAELYVDGQKATSSQELLLPASGSASADLTYTPQSGGMHRGEVRLVGKDGCSYDDCRWFVLDIDRGVPVAIVHSRQHEIPYLDDAFYLQNALSSGRSDGGAVAPTTLLASDLATESLRKYKVIFCVNLPAPDDPTARRLADYVAGGGRIVWICGDNVQPDAYNRMNDAVNGRLLPAALADVRSIDAKAADAVKKDEKKDAGKKDGKKDAKNEDAAAGEKTRDCWHIGFLDREYPPLTPLLDPPSLYESVLVYKHVRMATSAKEAGVLMRLDDGEPLFMQKPVEKGAVLLFGSSVQQEWSNLPRRPIFLPLLSQLTLFLSDVGPVQADAVAGQPLSFPLVKPEGNAVTPMVEVISPNGERTRVKAEEQGKPVTIFHHLNTEQIGIYRFKQLDTTPPNEAAYAVNFDPREADSADIDSKELQQHWPFGPIILADNPDNLAETFQKLREGKSLWALFLWTVLFGLVFETYLSNRFVPNQEEAAKAGGAARK